MSLTKNDLATLFKFDTHIHSNDISLCARTSVSDWCTFYSRHFPWVKALAFTNHSYSPGLYSSSEMDGNITLSNYADTCEDKVIISGLEVNILRDGAIDVKKSILDSTPWVIGAINKLKKEYPNEYVVRSAEEYEIAIKNTINGHKVDTLAHPLENLPNGISREINWEMLFELCKDNNVLVEVNMLIDNPDWWIQLLAKHAIKISLGTDWHGMYHFRFFDLLEVSEQFNKIKNTIYLTGRGGYDKLTLEDKLIYDNTFLQHNFYDKFYPIIGTEIERCLQCGVKPENIINTWNFNDFLSFLSTPRSKRII